MTEKFTLETVRDAFKLLTEVQIPAKYIIYLSEADARNVIENVYGIKYNPDEQGRQLIGDYLIQTEGRIA